MDTGRLLGSRKVSLLFSKVLACIELHLNSMLNKVHVSMYIYVLQNCNIVSDFSIIHLIATILFRMVKNDHTQKAITANDR